MDQKRGLNTQFKFGEKNDKSVKKVLATNKELIGVKVDPELKTADIDITNNSWPEKKSDSDFEKFKAKIKG
jgi:hypothetical protein